LHTPLPKSNVFEEFPPMRGEEEFEHVPAIFDTE
jgi:hypothetical protein